MNKQPLLILLVCFIIAIFICDYFLLSLKIIFSILIFSVLIVLLSFLKIKKFRNFKNISLGFFFFSIGLFCHALNLKKPNLPDFEGKQKVVFQLNKKLNSNEKYRRYEVSVLNIEHFKNSKILPINIVLSIPKEEKQLDFKNYYQTQIYLNKVELPNNDFQFNYVKYLARKNIFYQSFVSNEILNSPKKSLNFQEKIKQKRLEVLQNIDTSSLSAKPKEFLKGIILADRTEMDSETVSDFSKSGLVHFLAISGTHFAVIFWLILFLLKPVFPPKFRNFPIIISLILIWIFAVFIDFGSSVVRSCLMISVYYFHVLLQRKPDLLHALSIAAFAILIVDTHQLFDVGFQLSFLAVLGIFWLNEPILKYLPKPKNNIQNFFVNVVSISFSAQIVTLPLVVFYFHQYSFISIIANLVILPFSEIIIVFSLMMTVLFAFKTELSWLSFIYDFLVESLLKIIHWFADFDLVFYKNIPLNWIEVFLLLLSVYFLRDILLKKNLKSGIRFLLILQIFIGFRMGFNFYEFQKNEIIIANLISNKIVIIKNKNKVVFYINEKSNPEKIVKSIVEPYLNSRRINLYEIKILPRKATKLFFKKQEYHLK